METSFAMGKKRKPTQEGQAHESVYENQGGVVGSVGVLRGMVLAQCLAVRVEGRFSKLGGRELPPL